MAKNPYADTRFEEQPRPDVAVLAPKVTEKCPAGAAAQPEPVVTVVTAVFNAVKAGRKKELLQCLDSVQEQTGTAIEHLIVDGASRDGTVELIQAYQPAKFPIRFLSEPDAGIYDAMNRGLWLARGKYVIFLNSDDFYSNPEGLADCVRRLEETGCDFSYAPIRVLDETNDQPVEHLLTHPNVNMIFEEMRFSHQSMMIRRQSFLEINGFDLRYRSGADYDSVLRFIFTGHRACLVSTVFVSFRLGGFSHVNMEASQREVGTIFSRLYSRYLGVSLTPEEGTMLYLTKLGPKELRQRQHRFAKAAFGDAIESGPGRNTDPIPEDLLLLQFRLQTLKHHPGFLTAVRILIRLLCSSPVPFARFLRLYFRHRRKSGKTGAGKQAYLELLAQEQEKRRKKRAAAPGKDALQSIPPLPHPVITNQDYWHVNGIYPGEEWGAWTGRKVSVFFQLPEDYRNRPLTAEIHLGGFISPKSPKRIVDIVINGRPLGSITVANFMPEPHRFSIPAEFTVAEVLDFDFIVDQTFSPKSLGCGEDARELGMSFQKFSIRKAGPADGGIADPAKMQEIKVGFLNHFNKWWVGGITYFKNLFQAMETTESPHLRPYIFRSPDELADCLLPYVSTFPMQPIAADAMDHLPTAADYQMDVLSHLNGNQISEGRDGIAWIADFQHVHLPEMFDDKEIAFRNHSFHTLIAQNRIVCLSSYDAMEDFKKYAPESAHKARCLHFVSIPDPGLYPLPEAEAAEIRRRRQLPERYFYVPNQFWKHKNHITVLKAVAELKRSGTSVHVVFSGNPHDARFPHYFEELEAFCKQEQIEENVHFLGLIPLKEVYFLMRDCLTIINPSRFEGWSSSVEEAKSVGKTILLSNLNVHYEQMPPHGFYFPCDDPFWLADLMKRAWDEMQPGPDAAMEARAQALLPHRIKQFGKDFQQIVLDALADRPADATAADPGVQITVVTAVRDLVKNAQQEQFLRNLDSVAAQKGVTLEHLIVDGGSTDGTAEFLQPLLEKYGCRLVPEPARGLYEALNRGAIHAQGRYVAFLDAEAYYAADDFLQRSAEALAKADADFSCAAGDASGLAGMPPCRRSMLFLRKALYSVAVFNDTFQSEAGDLDLLLRLILAGKTAVRVEGAENGAAASAVPQRDPALVQRECARVWSRIGRRLDCALTPEGSGRIGLEKTLPEALKKLLQPHWERAFGTDRPERQ